MSADETRAVRPHHMDQRYLEERFKALEDRVVALEAETVGDLREVGVVDRERVFGKLLTGEEQLD